MLPLMGQADMLPLVVGLVAVIITLFASRVLSR